MSTCCWFHLTPGLIAYSVIFASSTVANHPFKGAALGTLLLIVLVHVGRQRDAQVFPRAQAILLASIQESASGVR